MAPSRCAEVTSTAQQGRPTICVKAFSCIFTCGVSLPFAVVSFHAILELVCIASNGEGIASKPHTGWAGAGLP